MGDKGGVGKAISLQDWEQIIQDFRTASDLQQRWLNIWPGLVLLEQALLTIIKKENPIKAQILVFIEENADILIGSEVPTGFGMILESLRGVLPSVSDGVIITNTLRENIMVMATAVAAVTDTLHNAREGLESLVELFLVFINRPNHTSDRHVRGLACDCLRELEMAYPCLLFGCVGHIHFLCLNEKTHANQSYTLLLATIVENLSSRMYTIRSKSANYLPILQNTAPLVPFSAPFFLVSSAPGREIQSIPARELTPGNLREFRTAVAFLLERPQLLTTVGMLELVSSLIRISKALDLSGPTLQTHFSSLLHSYSPILCHIVLLIYTHFMDSIDGDEGAILKRLIALSRDDSQSLPFRLLGVHWLLGVETLHKNRQKLSIIAPFASGLYPLVFDPLSLKAAKLGALAHCAVALDQQGIVSQENAPSTNGIVDPASQLLNEGLLSVSSYDWLPPWSTETQLAYHAFHRFLTVAVPHLGNSIPDDAVGFTDSPLFQTLQTIFVKMAAQKRKLVPNLVSLLDRLMGCEVHCEIAKTLLLSFNEELLPQLRSDRHLPSYFPLLERIAETGEIPPRALINKLAVYVRQRVDEDDAGDELELWSCCSEVLGICRTVLLHYQSSRIYHILGPLLGFLVRVFPDLEIRDTARFYLRMLISVPGTKVRKILKYGDERVEEGNSPQFSPASLPSAAPSVPSLNVASYILFLRITPLLVLHSWSMILFDPSIPGSWNSDEPNEKSSAEAKEDLGKFKKDSGTGNNADKQVGDDEINYASPKSSETTLRMMDTRTSEIIHTLRRHFSQIPDYINGPGLKITVSCTLSFLGAVQKRFLQGESEDFSMWSIFGSSISDSWPAIYATVITFKTSGSYGPIPKVRVPFLLSEPPQENWPRASDNSTTNNGEHLEVPASELKGKGKYYPEDDFHEKEDRGLVQQESAADREQGRTFHAVVIIELEPKRPVPTLLDPYIVFSDEQGSAVKGQLDSVPVGIEDLFVKPPVPADLVPEGRKDYLFQLFDAFWESCSGPGRLGTETFLLKGDLEAVSVQGSQSVKLLEAQADRVVVAVEHYLADFVVAVDGGPLTIMTKDAGVFNDVKWMGPEASTSDVMIPTDARPSSSQGSSNDLSLQIQVRDPGYGPPEDIGRSGLGTFLIIILLPPRYHLLLRMEVADESTLVRIRTDHWPCLAHVDEYLEALIMST